MESMNEARTTPPKIKVTVHLRKEAVDCMYDFGYASARTMGDSRVQKPGCTHLAGRL